MAMKDILVLLDANSAAAEPYATSFASRFQAHVTAATLVFDPFASGTYAEAPVDVLTTMLENARAAGRAIGETFAVEVRRCGVPVEIEVIETAAGMTDRIVGTHARYFDLTIVEQPNPDVPGERERMIEGALLGSNRPVLVVPYIQAPPLRLENVLVAWDGSATAARSIADAMPLLARARTVALVTVADSSEPRETVEVPGDRMRRHLARHAIAAQFHRLPKAGDVESMLLSHAFDSATDLIVMGGYGHSRFREAMLGGTTRGILRSMTVPVLMSH